MVSAAPPNVYDADCPTREALDLIADKWSSLVVGLLGERPYRFNELRRAIGGISAKVLAERLRDLERDGILSRTVYESVPPSVEYALTPLGRSLHAPLEAVTHWAERHIRAIHTARARYDAGLPAEAATSARTRVASSGRVASR